MNLSGWGRFPVADCVVSTPFNEAALRRLVTGGSAIARGNGRAYGDSALNQALTIHMGRFNRMIAFDARTGVLTVEAGVILGDIIEAFLPRGWFPSVTPGTKFVTVGGMIAADVHGKNHHKHGAFGGFVTWIDIMRADGDVVRCSPTDNADLFAATVGGMGLTGIILRAAFRLTPVDSAWIRQVTIPAANLAEAFDGFERSADWTYSVAWIDCMAKGRNLGRSLIMLGEHAMRAELDERRRRAPYAVAIKPKRRIPFDIPNFVLNPVSVAAFNAAYYALGRSRSGQRLVDWDSYFYPLDSVLEWNRIYGRRGFAQYQCVLPLAASRDGMAELLKVISASGQGSFLAVLKRMGPQDSLFSFPMEGYTLALDFAVSVANLALMDRLDAITVAHGGRFYLAKDSRMHAATLEQADGRVAAFRAARAAFGAANRFASLQSQRLRL